MEYYLYKLSFSTPLHIGRDTGGASLDDGQMTIHADTLVAALCCEAASSSKLNQLISYFADGTLTISDALPYDQNELYLPKPILFVSNNKRASDASSKKALKGIDFIPLPFFQEYLKSLSESHLNMDKLSQDFGQLTVTTRVSVNRHDLPLPYHVASWRFKPGCGLYIIVRSTQEPALELLISLLNSLGWSGIGGKQSSGWGKFQLEAHPFPEQLRDFLSRQTAEYQMLLGTALPVDDELENVLSDGWYSLIRRGGFIRSTTYAAGQLKKRTIHMLAPGSCVRRRFTGGMFDLSDNGTHPVWRCGNTLFVGVDI